MEPTARPRATGASRTPLVGRAHELQLLVARSSTLPFAALIEGEPGVGKTRLVEEFLVGSAITGRIALKAVCRPYDEPPSFGPVFDALRLLAPRTLQRQPGEIAGLLREFVPEIAHLLPDVPRHARDAGAARHQLFRATLEVLTSAAPVLLVIEDLHWADKGTRDLLRWIFANPPNSVGIVLTARSESSQHILSSLAVGAATGLPVINVTLEPLSPSSVKQFVEAFLGVESVSVQFAHYLHERTGGLPFAVEEVLRLLLERRDLVRDESGWSRATLDQLQVPRAVLDSVVERMLAMPSAPRRALEALSVLGSADEQTIAATGGVQQAAIATALTRAMASGLIREGENGLYELRHALIRQALYESIPAPRRRNLHLRAARGKKGDYMTLAYDAHTGTELWRTSYDGPASGTDRATDVAISPDGTTLYVTGTSAGSDRFDIATIAYDAATGATRWLRRYVGAKNLDDIARDVAVSPDGSTIVVTGSINCNCLGDNFGGGGDWRTPDIVSIAYDQSGSHLWTRTYDYKGFDGSKGADDGHFVAFSTDGHTVYVAGASNYRGATGVLAPDWNAHGPIYDIVLLAYGTRDGSVVWESRAGLPEGHAWPVGMAVTAAGNVRLGARTSSFSGGPVGFGVVEYDAHTGTPRIAHYPNFTVSPIGMTIDPQTGTLYLSGVRGNEIVTVSIDSTDRQAWAAQQNTSATMMDGNVASSISFSPSHNRVLVAGYAQPVPTQGANVSDLLTLAYRA